MKQADNRDHNTENQTFYHHQSEIGPLHGCGKRVQKTPDVDILEHPGREKSADNGDDVE